MDGAEVCVVGEVGEGRGGMEKRTYLEGDYWCNGGRGGEGPRGRSLSRECQS